MLILERKHGQKIMIGDDIEVILLGCRENKSKIGIVAPKNVSVHREEIYQRILNQKEGEKDGN